MPNLTTAKAKSAIRYNDRHMVTVGWSKRYRHVAGLLGLDTSPSHDAFVQALAGWQSVQRPALDADGKLGKISWRRMEPQLKTAAPVTSVPNWVKTAQTRPKPSAIEPLSQIGVFDATTPWMGVARREMERWDRARAGMTEEQREWTEGHTSMDEEYFHAAPRFGNVTHDLGEGTKKQNRDWCAAFVNYCLHRAGFNHTGSAWAASFASRYRWHFDALEEPQVGCVIVIGPGAGSHVGFLAETRGLPKSPGGDVAVADLPAPGVKLLGGNQSHTVRYKRYKRSLISARGRNGIVSPYFMPLQDGANCNIGLPTAHAHSCHYTHER